MPLDLNIEVEKTREEKLADIKRSIFSIVKMSAIQIRNNRDNVRRMMLENPEFTALEINEYLGEAVSEQLAQIDTESSELLAKVSM